MELLENVDLADKTTLRVGGFARFFVEAHSVTDIREALLFAKKEGMQHLVLGEGSNVLFSDDGFHGLVLTLKTNEVVWEEESDIVRCIASAGARWDEVVQKSVAKGLWGIENLSMIPGFVGAAPIQNIGAYGVEFDDVCLWVEVLDTQTDAVLQLDNEACQFRYRDSLFKKDLSRYVVLRVCMELSKKTQPQLEYKDVQEYFLEQGQKRADHEADKPGNETETVTPTVQEVRDAIVHIRSRKFPDIRHVGTAGSFFKNPIISKETFGKLREHYPNVPGFMITEAEVKVPLAWILEHVCNVKGERRGNVGLFERQALVLVTYQGATASEVLAFVSDIKKNVQDKVGIAIEEEVRIVLNDQVNDHADTLEDNRVDDLAN